MATLTITRGLPGSGKTTWARQQVGAVRVNRDDLRRMLHGRHLGFRRAEAQVSVAHRALLAALLGTGVSVICDDTNLSSTVVRELRKIAAQAGAEVVIRDFVDVPIDICIARDAARHDDTRVGEAAIRAMHRRYLAQADR
jgi:predicted kinase